VKPNSETLVNQAALLKENISDEGSEKGKKKNSS
jgi:hypothetical protein